MFFFGAVVFLVLVPFGLAGTFLLACAFVAGAVFFTGLARPDVLLADLAVPGADVLAGVLAEVLTGRDDLTALAGCSDCIAWLTACLN